MFYAEDLIEDIRTRNDIVDVISSYVKLERKGSSHFGLCPFHNEKSPSFSVTRNKQMYYCFGCGVGGSVFTFIMEYENFTFVETVKFLANRVGIDLPEITYSDAEKEKANLKSRYLEINKEAGRFFYAGLRVESGEKAYSYLINREINAEMLKEFGVGYAGKFSDSLYQYLRGKGYTQEEIYGAGLIQVDELKGVYDRFWNRIIFPIMDVNSRVIGFGGRVIGEGSPKYLNSPETIIFDKSRNLYGLNRARTSRKRYFLVCEGYLDVIALHQSGFTNAVATLGTALTSGHASLLKRYVDQIYLTYDSDEAGVRAAIRALPLLKGAGISARIISMEPYKDPDDFIKNMGSEAFEKRIQEARNGFLFSLEILERDYEMDSPEGKTAFFLEVAKRLLTFEEQLERTNYIEAVAKEYQIQPDSLTKLVTKMAIQEGMAKPYTRPSQLQDEYKPKEDGFLTAQKVLLTWMIDDVQLFGLVKDHITPQDFTDGLYRKVATLLFEQFVDGQVNAARALNHFENEEEHRQVAALFHTVIQSLESKEAKEQALKEVIVRVKRGSLEARNKELDPMDFAGLQEILEEKRALEQFAKS